MHDIKDLERRVSATIANSSIRVQENALTMLLGQVQKIVESIKAENDLVKQIASLKKDTIARSNDPKEAERAKEALTLLQEAKKIEYNIASKRALLKKIEHEVSALLSEIRKAA